MPKKQKESIKVDPVGPRTAMFKRTLRTARSGYTYVFESDEWRIGSRFKIPWNVLKTRGLNERVSSDLLDSFRELFAELVEEVSDSYARKVFDQIVSLFDFCVDLITVEAVEAWRTRLSICGLSKKTQRDYFTVCRVALNAWSDSNYPGLGKGLTDHLNRIKVGGSKPGRAVRELCPVRGPFTHAEESAFIRWLHESYADGSLPLQVYAMLLVMVEFGCRPVELAALRAGDVIDGDAEQPYQLAIWSAKGGRKYRSVFRTLELPADLYALLKQVMVETHAQVAEAWDETIPPAISKQLPLFVGRRLLAAGSPEAFVHRIQKVPNAFDITVSDQMRTWFRKCPLTTGRLDGDLMPLSLYRFRRTIGTRLAEAGASDEVIATVLGHSSMVSLRDYTAHTYADQEACDAIMVAAWDPVINIMKDRLLDAPIPGQATIHVTRHEQVGNCGQLCGGGIFTCYACPKFRPFVDAPHHIALARAESERKRRIDQNLSGPEVDSLDLPIAAIKATMRLCEDYHPQEVGDE
jgi:integrase